MSMYNKLYQDFKNSQEIRNSSWGLQDYFITI